MTRSNTFGKDRRRETFEAKQGPGPCQYELSKSLLRLNSPTIKGKRRESRNLNPGPGAYETVCQNYYVGRPGYILDKAPRKPPFEKKDDYHTPGPGAHTP